jgi:hypothetical protein|tara:strand:+ start:1092 stop:1364 length:273 start_codon:yes stop_codon:yes gene_type:complete
MKEGRHNGVNVKYFCSAFKQFKFGPAHCTPAHDDKKKRDVFKHLSKVTAGKQETSGNCQCIIPKIFCERVLTRLMGELQFMHLDMIKPPV